MKLRDQETRSGGLNSGSTLHEDVFSISPEDLESLCAEVPPMRKSQRSANGKLLRFPTASNLKAQTLARKTKESSGGSNVGHEAATKGRNPKVRPNDDQGIPLTRAPLLERVKALVNNIEEKLVRGDAKPTVADWIRLTEIERELTSASGPRQIRVTWVTPNQSDVMKIFGPRKRGPEGGQDAA